jgi:hypothetical protein
MSYENPISVIKNSAGEKKRKIKEENIHKKYTPYLRDLVLRMIKDDPKLRPTSNEAYDELEVIEIYKSIPNNKIIKKSLDELNKQNKSIPDQKGKENKNFQIAPTDKENKLKSGIKPENKSKITPGNKLPKEKEFISSNGIYSNSNKNLNLKQSIKPSNNTTSKPQYVANNSLNNSLNANNSQYNFKRYNTAQIPQLFPPPTSQIIYTPIGPSMNQPINQSINLPINPPPQDVEVRLNLPGMFTGIFNKIKKNI